MHMSLYMYTWCVVHLYLQSDRRRETRLVSPQKTAIRERIARRFSVPVLLYIARQHTRRYRGTAR